MRTHIELETRYSEVVRANVNEQECDATVMDMKKEGKRIRQSPSRNRNHVLKRMIEKLI